MTEKIRAEVERLKDELIKAPNKSEIDMGRISAFEDILLYIDSLPKEPVSEDLKEAATKYARNQYRRKDITTLSDKCRGCYAPPYTSFVTGANWQKQNLWKDAQGDDLPEIDREVVALQGRKVVFAHRPNPEGWDGKSLSTGEVEHYTPQTYDKGGWNIEGVTYWLDVELPEGIE